MQNIHAEKTVSVTELKRNFSAILSQAEDDPVAVLNHNRPEAYLLSAAHYERLLERLEDLEDACTAEKAYLEFKASGEKGIPLEEVMREHGLEY